MRAVILVLCFIWTASASSDVELWKKFKADHSKTYKSIIEEQQRFAIFQKALRTIESHNVKYENGESTYKKGINQFADLTPEEFKARLGLNYRNVNLGHTSEPVVPDDFVVPASLDWREKGAVLAVRDQGGCGSCWAFSAIGSLEGQQYIKHGKQELLSEQELVDCSKGYYNMDGCNGGRPDSSYEYIRDHGIATEEDYNYTAKEGTCRKTNRANLTVTGFKHVAVNNETELQILVALIGPISVALNSAPLQYYDSGILDDPDCPGGVDHAVLAVGYGTNNSVDYWIAKNSWGTDFGEDGYFRIVRNKNNQCCIACANFYPEVL